MFFTFAAVILEDGTHVFFIGFMIEDKQRLQAFSRFLDKQQR
jgi:hypothetical protein